MFFVCFNVRMMSTFSLHLLFNFLNFLVHMVQVGTNFFLLWSINIFLYFIYFLWGFFKIKLIFKVLYEFRKFIFNNFDELWSLFRNFFLLEFNNKVRASHRSEIILEILFFPHIKNNIRAKHRSITFFQKFFLMMSVVFSMECTKWTGTIWINCNVKRFCIILMFKKNGLLLFKGFGLNSHENIKTKEYI